MQCLVYSFGSNNEFSFDDTMGSFGCQVFTFDPYACLILDDGVKNTTVITDDHERSKHVHFFRMGLYHEDIEMDDRGWKLKTLSSIYELFKPVHGEVLIDYLKIDIEEAEWKVKFT